MRALAPAAARVLTPLLSSWDVDNLAQLMQHQQSREHHDVVRDLGDAKRLDHAMFHHFIHIFSWVISLSIAFYIWCLIMMLLIV